MASRGRRYPADGSASGHGGDDEGESFLEFEVPLAAIRSSSLKMLSMMLNPVKVIPTESGLPRDWRGLAELSGIPSETIAYLQVKADPVSELMQILCKSGDSRCQLICDLTAFLAVIDRYDVVADATPMLVADANHYKAANDTRCSQRSVVSPLDPSIEKNILTVEDSERVHQGQPLTRYDAFILYADEDTQFANQIVEEMEGKYSLKLCVKDRDLLPGVMFEHEIIGRLIEERCNRFIVVFSRHFEKSPANNFLVSYAQASAMETRTRKIIPCVFEECHLPPSVRFLSTLKYYRSENMFNFWERLSQSIKAVVGSAKASHFPMEKDRYLDEPMTRNNELERNPIPKKYSPPPTYSQSMKMVQDLQVYNPTNDPSKPSAFPDLKLPDVPNEVKKKTKWYDKLKKVKKSKNKSKQKCELLAE